MHAFCLNISESTTDGPAAAQAWSFHCLRPHPRNAVLLALAAAALTTYRAATCTHTC